MKIPADTAEITLQSVKSDVNALLLEFFDERITLAQSLGQSYVRLWETIRDLNQAGGKRFRPYVVMLGYHTFTDKSAHQILPVAAAWELLHLCLLIHDDIIDNDVVRYGVKNIAGSYDDLYQPLETNVRRRKHLATGAALLAGDLAHSGAHELVLKSTLSSDQKILAQHYLTAATFSVAGGELLDTESVLYDFDAVDAYSIARYKTASYSFVGPSSCGAALAGASDHQLNILEEYGSALGCAFQLIDDLLGVFGDESVTGKTIVGDIREGKRTRLMQLAFDQTDSMNRATLNSLVGKPDITDDEAAIVRSILVDSGAKSAVEDLVAEYMQTCSRTLELLNADGINTRYLESLTSIVTKRSN